MGERICPVCYTEQNGLFCKRCGWDFTVDYLECDNLSGQEQEWYGERLSIMRENYKRLMEAEQKNTELEERLKEITFQRELEKSVQNKTPLEICKIGCNWLLGSSGYEVDMDKAFFYLSRAAQQNEPTALHNLGWMYANGKGTEKNLDKALKCYKKAAEQNHPSAQSALGWLYMKGFAVPQDDAEAVKWYRKSAEKNHAIAQFYMGFMYENGRGVIMDKKEAAKWYQRAAEQGQKDAQFYLGKMYESGEGLSQDFDQAKKWYQKAADNGDMDAKKKLENWK